MTAHARIVQQVPTTAAVAFDLLHDYPHRLDWDTLLRRAYTVGGAAPARGVQAVCSARWHLGGFSFRTRYVTFDRPVLAAVVLVNSPPVFAKWAASIRHADHGDGTSELAYTLTFTTRPHWAAPVVERVALAAFRAETTRRLRALAAYLGRQPTAARTSSGTSTLE